MEKSDFKERFRDLYNHSGCSSITEFAQKLDMNRQSVDRYYNGERCPDAPALAKICKKMGVSADWLLTISNVKEPSADLRAVCEYTGLPEQTINYLKRLDPVKVRAVASFIQHEDFDCLLFTFSDLLKKLEEMSNRLIPGTPGGNVGLGEMANLEVNQDGTVSIPTLWQALQFLCHQIGFLAENIAQEEIQWLLMKQ